MIKNIIQNNAFTVLTKFIVIILPFYVLLKVFFEHKIGVPYFGFFIKEFIIVGLFIALAYEYIKRRMLPRFGYIEILIILYIIYGVIITLINGHGIGHLIHGGRYDFMFFIVFLIYKNGKVFLQISKNELGKLFLISGGIAIIISVIIKFRIGEEFLTLFGFIDYISNWTFNGSIPNYHGLENSGIRRLSGIFESPNTMAFFLIIYGGIFLWMQQNKGEYYVWMSIFILGILLILTFSRSAILGVGVATGIIILFHIKTIFKYHKKMLSIGIVGGLLITGIFGFIFHDKIKNIIIRSSSTKGHFERMEIGIQRFIDKPLGHGLSEAGPGFRKTHNSFAQGKTTKEIEEYYIPESWYIQQLVEGGYIFLLLFLLILYDISRKLYLQSHVILGLFIAVMVMNLFLHIFEATYLSILLFLFLGLFYGDKNRKKIYGIIN